MAGSQATTSVEAVKARPKVKVSHAPGNVVAGKTRALLTISASADGQPLTGKLRIDLPGGEHVNAQLVNGAG